MGFLLVLLLGTMPSTLPSLFPTHIRYGGFAISYNVSTSAFGGTAPYIITALIAGLHDKFIPAYYLIGAAAVAIVPILLSPETAGVSLRGRSQPGVRAQPVAAAK
jgi:MHS family proline/betaine transporter-like MFS transporter